MKTTTVSMFRAKMKEHLEEVQKDQDILILSGPKNKDFVLITLEQFNAMEETAHLLSTPNNASRLMESIAQDRAGEVAESGEFPAVKPNFKAKKRIAKRGVPVKKHLRSR